MIFASWKGSGEKVMDRPEVGAPHFLFPSFPASFSYHLETSFPKQRRRNPKRLALPYYSTPHSKKLVQTSWTHTLSLSFSPLSVLPLSHYCKQIPKNSSRLIAPSPSKSNSSIIAANSSSPRPSPSSRATLLKSCRSILPLFPSSKSSNARRISSRGSRARMRWAMRDWKAGRGSRRRVGWWDWD